MNERPLSAKEGPANEPVIESSGSGLAEGKKGSFPSQCQEESQDNEQGVQVWAVIVEEGRIPVGTKQAGAVSVVPTTPEGVL